MSSIIGPVFTGVSTFASDLQQVITRTVAIANLPIRQLQNQLQTLNSQSSALSGLNTVFGKLQTSIASLNTAIGAKSYAGTSSDPSSVGVSVAAGALNGSYTVDVASVGSYSTSISNPALPVVADPSTTSISTSATFTLSVNGTDFTITPGDGSLTGLAKAINSSSSGVHASLVNVGGSGAPAYRLVLRSDNLGEDTIQLNDGSQDLLDNLNTGALAEYTVNGLPTPIQSTSRNVTLAPGVTLDLLRETTVGQPVTVTVSRDTTQASTAISDFVSAYNAVVGALDQQVGKDAGSLAGQSIVRDLRENLRQILQFAPSSGNLKSLSGLGINLDKTGLLTFDQVTFDANSTDDVQTFLGSAETGGFLKVATDALKGVEDSTTGSLSRAIDLMTKQISRQNDQISDRQQRLIELQDSLQQRIAAADALIASLESQRTYLTGLFTAQLNANKGN